MAAALVSMIGSSVAFSTPVLAQEGPAAPAQPASISTEPAVQRDNATPADRFGFLNGQQLQVTTGTEEDKLSFRIALPAAPSIATRFALTFQTPLQSGDNAMPASLDSLANGTRVTLSVGYFDLRVGPPSEARTRLRDRAIRLCRQASARNQQALEENGAPNTAQDRCAVSSYAMRKYDLPGYLADQGQSPPATDYGLDLTVGLNGFEWVDPVTLTPQKAQRTDWSATAHVIRWFAGSHSALTGSISYQRAHEATEERLICPPNPVDPATQCITARGAAPTVNESLLVSAGFRHRFADGIVLRNLALAPTVTYDALDDIWGAELPIYFISDSEGNLTGGLRIGYRSDREDRFTIGLFFGTTFGLPRL